MKTTHTIIEQTIRQVRLLGIGLAAIAMGSGAFAASGIFGAHIGITQGGSQTIAGGITGTTGDTRDEFQSPFILSIADLNLGDSLTISAAEVLTFKDGSSDVTGAELNYRVYASGSTAGSFTAVSIGWSSNRPFTDLLGNNYGGSGGGDQSWGNISSTPDIAAGLSAGSYVLEVFWKVTSSDGDHHVNNNGNNYTASFSVVPEPSTFALLAGLAGLAAIALRRRKAL